MGGALILASSVIKLLSYSPVDFLTKFESFSWMLDLAFFIACIWGSVKVFGKFTPRGFGAEWGSSWMGVVKFASSLFRLSPALVHKRLFLFFDDAHLRETCLT